MNPHLVPAFSWEQRVRSMRIQEIQKYFNAFHRKARRVYGLKAASRNTLLLLPPVFIVSVLVKFFPRWQGIGVGAVLGIPLLFLPLYLWAFFTFKRAYSAAAIDSLLQSEERLATFSEMAAKSGEASSLERLAWEISRFLSGEKGKKPEIRTLSRETRSLAILYPCILLLLLLPPLVKPAGEEWAGRFSQNGGFFFGEEESAGREGPFLLKGKALKGEELRKALTRLKERFKRNRSWQDLERDVEELRGGVKRNEHLERAASAAAQRDMDLFEREMSAFFEEALKKAGTSLKDVSGQAGGPPLTEGGPKEGERKGAILSFKEARERYMGKGGEPAPIARIRWSPAYNDILDRYFTGE